MSEFKQSNPNQVESGNAIEQKKEALKNIFKSKRYRNNPGDKDKVQFCVADPEKLLKEFSLISLYDEDGNPTFDFAGNEDVRTLSINGMNGVLKYDSGTNNMNDEGDEYFWGIPKYAVTNDSVEFEEEDRDGGGALILETVYELPEGLDKSSKWTGRKVHPALLDALINMMSTTNSK